jgi:phytanoyl-CoA hydroxylase
MPTKPFTDAHVAQFHRDGILCVPEFVPNATVEALKAEMVSMVDAEADRRAAANEIGVSFDVHNQSHGSEEYFLNSAGNISFLLEKGCTEFSLNNVNKVGHALHTDGGIFQQFTSTPVFGAIARRLGRRHPSVVQSMYILKSPRIGGEVPTHQDSTWIHTRPLSCLAMWFALDDCTVENSCLQAVIGSHQDYPITAHAMLNTERTASSVSGELHQVDPSALTPLECPKGSLVVFDGSTLHCSTQNTSSMKRHAYVFHLVDDAAAWNERNWLDYNLRRLAL